MMIGNTPSLALAYEGEEIVEGTKLLLSMQVYGNKARWILIFSQAIDEGEGT